MTVGVIVFRVGVMKISENPKKNTLSVESFLLCRDVFRNLSNIYDEEILQK